LARIGINTRFLIKGKLEGFGWYTYEVCKRLVEKHPEHDFYFFFDRPYEAEFLFADNVKPIVIQPAARHPFLFILWFEWLLPKALKENNIDVFFSPDGYLSLRSTIPQIGTIHDINFEHYPEDLPFMARWYLRKYFPKFAARANQLITVSAYSKQDIATTYGIKEHKISVAHNGVSDKFKPLDSTSIAHIRSKHSKGKPYFLFVGSLHPRKNLKRLIEAFTNFRKESSEDWNLLIVGEYMWKKDLGLQSSLFEENIIFTGRLNQEELTKVMAAAGALAYVPYFEGFGIPLVEAMRSGVPILSGNLTSLPEVAGDAAIYCDPFSVESISAGMKDLAANSDLRDELVKKGLERAKLFSWDQSAEVVWNEIRKLLDQ
jgi:glycosyltransferase involved in cell wall biosynthesis